MSYDSAPSFEKAPTFDDIVKYACDNDLFGKISLVKFYDWYGDFKGKGGAIIDWQAKMHQWASRQRSQVIVTAKEYEAQKRVQSKTKPAVAAQNTASDIWAKVAMI